jgi:hypothetical protein
VVISSNIIQPGDSISLATGVNVRARCSHSKETTLPPDNLAFCETWPIMVINFSVVLQFSSNPSTPSITLSTNDVIGACGDMYLDLSGSQGSAGRNWLSASITATTRADTPSSSLIDDLNDYIFEKRFQSRITVPTLFLDPEIVYTIFITKCNFLNICGSVSRQVIKLDEQSSGAPHVEIAGASSLLISSKDELILSSRAFTKVCGVDGLTLIDNLQFSWRIYDQAGVKQNTIMTSFSSDPSKLRLPSNSLIPSSSYSMTLAVSRFNRKRGIMQIGSASVTITVEAGNVIPVITSYSGDLEGSDISLSPGETSYLKSDKSFDQNQPGLKGHDAGLSFDWRCQQLSPVNIINSCDAVQFIYNSSEYYNTQSFLSFSHITENSSSLITLRVIAPDGREAQKSVKIHTLRPDEA